MDAKELEVWKRHNIELQNAYQNYLVATNQREKDYALKDIQRSLEWAPFTDYVTRKPLAMPFGTYRYGLDVETEKCIREINLIANEEKEY